MSALAYISQHVIPAAFAMLPARLNRPGAKEMLLAIGLQESRFEHRRQIGGPARGFWQFERLGGVRGVLNHRATQPHILTVLAAMRYSELDDTCYDAIAHNDVLACCFARLLIYTHPDPLPTKDEPEKGWSQYIECWRPGKPHRATWDAFYREAWA